MTQSYPLITNSKQNPHSGALSHYCKSWDIILSILKTGLRFSYCLEKFSTFEIGIPMVSFCDVPIFKNNEHTERYGNYTIALSKEYLYNKYQFCAPVRYIRSDDPIFSANASLSSTHNDDKVIDHFLHQANAEYIDEITENAPIIVEMGNKVFKAITHDKYQKILEHLDLITTTTKSYYISLGYLKRISEEREQDNITTLQSNYDECEWRVITIPNQKIGNCHAPDWTDSEQYKKWRGDKSIPKQFLNIPPIIFSVKDIAYILIPNELELNKAIADIWDIDKLCGQPISLEDKEILCSKIITRDAINKYF